MRQLAIICCLVGTFVLWGCGGHKKTPPTPPAKVTFDVPGISLTFGEIFTIPAASVHVVDASGNVLTNGPAFTVSSANTNLVTINGSEICGGIFNANVTVCNPKDANGNFLTAGSTTITISAQGVNSDPIPVSVHPRVSSAIVVSPSNSCVSQNQTSAAYTVVACSAGTAPACTGGTNIANTLGTITWSTSDSTIATVDSNGIVTSKLPGAVNITATLGNVNVVNPTAALFVACPPKTISIHVTGVTNTTFNLNPSDPTSPTTSVKLDADVTDTAGQPITGAALTWSSFTPASATVGSDGTVTAVSPGTTAVVASCTPPTCNNSPGLSPQPIPAGTGLPVFSNLVTGSVAGTSAPAVYATAPLQTDGATANMVLLTIDPANPGTPQSVTLPHPANSMVFDHTGAKAYLGTADGHGIMQFDPNSPTTAPTVLGDGTIT
ncbi:MAG TPA: Ig-like domain-containing protein, partial [Terriglobales bacterium]